LSFGKIVICHPHNIEGIFQQNKVEFYIKDYNKIVQSRFEEALK